LSLIIDNTKQLILVKRTLYLHLGYYKPWNTIHKTFPQENISVWQGTLAILSKSKLK